MTHCREVSSTMNSRSVIRAELRGATLLEILIALVVVSVGMMGYFILHIQASRTSGESSNLAQATSIAMALQDSLMSVPYSEKTFSEPTLAKYFTSCGALPSNPVANLCNVESAVNAVGTTNAAQGRVEFARSWHVVQDTTNPSLYRYVVRVRYSPGAQRTTDCVSSSIGCKAVTFSTVRSPTGNAP